MLKGRVSNVTLAWFVRCGIISMSVNIDRFGRWVKGCSLHSMNHSVALAKSNGSVGEPLKVTASLTNLATNQA